MPESEYAVVEEETKEEFWLERLDTQDSKVALAKDDFSGTIQSGPNSSTRE